MVKYYGPSLGLANELQEELRHYSAGSDGPPQLGYRAKNTKSKRKYDVIDKVFQSLLDVVYFLEFIEDHQELHEAYEDELKDIFGVSDDDSSSQPFHKNNRGTSLFSRFLNSSLFNNWTYSDGVNQYNPIDFRLLLIDNMIDRAISALRFRLGTSREAVLFGNNAQNTALWSDLLASRYKEKPRMSHKRIGYCIPITYRERDEIKSEERRKAQQNLA